MDPKRRLRMQDLQCNEWLKGANSQVFSTTPLVTPDVLSLKNSSLSKTNNQFCATINAFHQAARQGFLLQEVGNAPLAKRRKMKKSSGSSRSSSNSSMSSNGSVTPTKSLTSSPARNLSSASSSSAASLGFVPRGGAQHAAATTASENSGYFSFRESRIAQLLPTMTTGSDGDRGRHKRKLDVTQEEDEEEVVSDDDCVIIGEEMGHGKKNSDSVNNNNRLPTKRPRMDTIVIE